MKSSLSAPSVSLFAAALAACPAGVVKHSDPSVKECRSRTCRGRIVPLLLKMCRAVADREDLPRALDALLEYMASKPAGYPVPDRGTASLELKNIITSCAECGG